MLWACSPDLSPLLGLTASGFASVRRLKSPLMMSSLSAAERRGDGPSRGSSGDLVLSAGSWDILDEGLTSRIIE